MKTDPTMPTTELKVGRLSFDLVFDFNAIGEAEDILDRPLLAGLSRRDVGRPTLSLVRAMFFACAHRHHPDLTFQEASALVTRHTMSEIWSKTLDAWTLGMNEPDPDEVAPVVPTPGQS